MKVQRVFDSKGFYWRDETSEEFYIRKFIERTEEDRHEVANAVIHLAENMKQAERIKVELKDKYLVDLIRLHGFYSLGKAEINGMNYRMRASRFNPAIITLVKV